MLINYLFTFFILSGCKTAREIWIGDEACEEDIMPQALIKWPETLDGVWHTDCYMGNIDASYNKTILTFEGNIITSTIESFNDISCSNLIATKTYKYVYTEEKSVEFINNDVGKYFSATVGASYKETPKDSTIVNKFNNEERCGLNNWTLNQEKTCPDNEAGLKIYGLFSINDQQKKLVINTSNEDYPDHINDADKWNVYIKQ